MIANTISTLSNGTARHATVVQANFDLDRGCSFADGIDWAAGQGASVFSRSAGPRNPEPTGQSATNLHMDWRAHHSPWATFVASAGNDGQSAVTGNQLANGIVVGAANDHGSTDRSQLDMRENSSGTNVGGAQGWEFPHLVAPGDIWTAGLVRNTTTSFGDTSAATPQVAGVVASLQEADPLLQIFAVGSMAIRLAASEQDVDGVWSLNLGDTVDDWDGVGALNGYYTSTIVRRRVLPGGYSDERGWNVEYVSAQANPAGQWSPPVLSAPRCRRTERFTWRL